MSTDNNDIKIYSAEDINRYWQGKLSAQEMHAMERAAMDDPFLADAMEGYSSANTESTASDLQELRERLSHRAASRKNYGWWRIAAAIILLAGASMLTYVLMQKNETKLNTVAKSEPANMEFKGQGVDSSALATTAATDSINAMIRDIKTDTAPALQAYISPKDTFIAGPTPKGYSYSQQPVSGNTKNETFASTIETKTVPDLSKYKPVEKPANPSAGFNIGTQKDSAVLVFNDAARNAQTQGRSSAIPNNAEVEQMRVRSSNRDDSNRYFLNNFSGRVVDNQNNALPYASLRLNYSNQSITTDNNGNFLLRSPDSVMDVSVSSVGFESRQLTLRSNQPPQQVVLDPLKGKDKMLSEVVVTGSSARKKQSVSKTSDVKEKSSDLKVYPMEAQPVIGWDEYNAYLAKNKQTDSTLDAFVKGDVIVSFNVSKNGRLSSFAIEKSLGKEQDAEAIRLIKDGPEWKVLKGKKTRARVIVSF